MYVCIMVCIFYSLLPPYSVESLVILTVNHVPPLHMHSAVECAAVSVSSMDLADNYHHDQQKRRLYCFDPSSRHKLYLAELLGFKKCQGKDWAAFVEELKTLVDSLYLSYRTTSETI